MALSYSAGREFVNEIRPILERGDGDELIAHLRHRWPNPHLREMLSCECEDAVKTALACLSYRGTQEDTGVIAPFLQSADDTLAAIAEHATWAIWFRSGDPVADRRLAGAVQLIGDSRLQEALVELHAILQTHPRFAEAHDQRATAYFLMEDYRRALVNYRRVLRYNPRHFGAMAGLGHCYAALGRLGRAYDAYREALRLAPRMEGIRQAIQQVREALSRTECGPVAEPAGQRSFGPQGATIPPERKPPAS